MSWIALNRAMQAYGAPGIDYQRFAKLYDSDPSLQDLVDNFDKSGLQVKTNAGDEMASVPQQSGEDKPMMAAAAKRAAANFGK